MILKQHFIPLTIILLLFSCKEMTNRAKQQKTVPVACLNVENESIEKDQPQDTLNFTDQKGLKQGVWKSYLNRKLWKSETYKDGQLSGKRYEYLANGEVMESEYLNGVRHGYYLHYEPHERFGKFVTYWENGKALWSAFPWELESLIVPVKGFITKLDTVEVRVPYNSGKLMYKGTIIGNADLYHETIGIHKAYYETGELKAIVDYNNNKIEIFSKNGETIEISTIDDRRGS